MKKILFLMAVVFMMLFVSCSRYYEDYSGRLVGTWISIGNFDETLYLKLKADKTGSFVVARKDALKTTTEIINWDVAGNKLNILYKDKGLESWSYSFSGYTLRLGDVLYQKL